MQVRNEMQADWPATYQVNCAAFKTPAKADLVDKLRQEAQPIVTLVADDGGVVVGHIMFSPVTLTGHPTLKIMGLGPMAVAPARHRSGIGSLLVRAGLNRCEELGFGAVVVLGHPEYYPRFGFVPSVRYGIRWEHKVPEEVFMVLELQTGILSNASGTIKYHPAFQNV